MKNPKPYRELKQELDEILDRLQDPGTSLDEALALQKKAKELLDQLEEYLKEVEEKIAEATKE